MGMYYKAAIVVGLLSSGFDDSENLEKLRDNDEITDFPPYYDGCGEGVLGVLVQDSDDYSATELSSGLDEKIATAKAEFKNLTGQDGKVWLTPVGY